jgi:hypothetical protein
MQGNRISKDEYILIEEDVIKKLHQSYPMARTTKFYTNKESFGDLDVIIVAEPIIYLEQKEKISTYLKDLFDAREIEFYDNIIKFEYKDFQIDLIVVNESNFDIAHFFYSYNDMNNIIAHIVKKFGICFDQDGLSVNLYDSTNTIRTNFSISKDPRKIYNFLKLDYNRYLDGFNNLDEIFQFIVSSPFFTSNIFKKLNSNHKNRKLLLNFSEWLSENGIDRNFRWKDDPSDWYTYIEDFFNVDIAIQIERLNTKVAFRKKLVSKFNENFVKNLTDLDGVQLIKFINDFKYTKDNFDEWVEDSPEHIIESDIIKFKEIMIG